MPGTGERAYAYAKACGIIGKSIIGKRINRLEAVGRLSELDRLVFPLSARDLPEKELLVDLESRIITRSVNSIVPIVDSYSRPLKFLILLLRGYEYADLKNVISALLEGGKTIPAHTDLGRFQTVRFEAWPDLPAMLKGTEFGFLLDEKGRLRKELDGVSVLSALDRYYYSALWLSLSSLSRNDRLITERILSDEISLKNSCWALRLRTYYRKSPDEVKLHLIDKPVQIVPAQPAAGGKRKPRPESKTGFRSRSLAREALQSLEFPLDSFDAWSSWRWKKLLNPESGEGLWTADPRYFQNAASLYLFRLARRYFRSRPFLLSTIFCFVKLKQFEEDILTSSAEGLGMGMSGKDIISALGLEP